MEQSQLGLADGIRALQHNSASRARLAHFLCVTFLVTIVTMILPAWILITMEPTWSYIDAVYFCFISLATIGFGDLVPDSDSWDESRRNTPLQELYHFIIIGKYSFPVHYNLITTEINKVDNNC